MEDRKKFVFHTVIFVLWILYAYLALDEKGPVDALIYGAIAGLFVASSIWSFVTHIIKTGKERMPGIGWLIVAVLYGAYLAKLHEGVPSKIFSFWSITGWFLGNFIVGWLFVGAVLMLQYERWEQKKTKKQSSRPPP